jgi:hypothetical protein
MGLTALIAAGAAACHVSVTRGSIASADSGIGRVGPMLAEAMKGWQHSSAAVGRFA